MKNRNKSICEKCKYHGYFGHNGPNQIIICMRIKHKFEACIGRDGKDKRGDDPEACLLFEEGDALEK